MQLKTLCIAVAFSLAPPLPSLAGSFERSIILSIPQHLTIEQAKLKAIDQIRQDVESESGMYVIGAERLHDDKYSETVESVTASTIRVTPAQTSIDVLGEKVRLHMTARVDVVGGVDLRHLSTMEENARLRARVSTSSMALPEPDAMLKATPDLLLNDEAVLGEYNRVRSLWQAAIAHPLEKDVWVVTDRRATDGYVEVGLSWQLDTEWLREMLWESVGMVAQYGRNAQTNSHRLPVSIQPSFRNRLPNLNYRVGTLRISPPDMNIVEQEDMGAYEQLRYALANVPVTGVLRVGDHVKYIPVSPGVGLQPSWKSGDDFWITVTSHPTRDVTVIPFARNPIRIETDDTGPLALRFDMQIGLPPSERISGVSQ